jgi:hypothetical protein
MSRRERLHQLVDELPDEAAARVLADLERRRQDPVRWALDHAPGDDEPETASERERSLRPRPSASAARPGQPRRSGASAGSSGEYRL